MNAVQTLLSPVLVNPMVGSLQKTVDDTAIEAPMQILIVEDDREIAQLLGQTIAENGFLPRFATCAGEMDAELRRAPVDLIILDIMLPGENGISICQRLRGASSMPIVMLTALDEDIERILALELGADDYVTKPFNSRELTARIRTILRRARGPGPVEDPAPTTFLFSGWRLSTTERQLFNADGARVTTTSAEFDLLVAFCQNPGRILSRDQLLELTHNGLAGPVERTIDVHISRIRQKIEPNPREPSAIKTVRLGGYLFTAPVEAS